jgi:hypothetical protein
MKGAPIETYGTWGDILMLALLSIKDIGVVVD